MKISLISSSTRIGRNSDRIALALQKYIQDNLKAECVIIDLHELNIPMFSQRFVDMEEPKELYLSLSSSIQFLLTGEILKKIGDNGLILDNEYEQIFENFCKEFIEFVVDAQLKKIKISRANFSDLQGILKMQLEAFQYEAQIYQRNDLPALMQDLESIQTDFSTYDYYKATYNHELAGAVRSKLTNSTCTIERLMVSPKLQKNGIGKKLMDFIENKHPNIEKFELITGRRSVANIRFYEKRGYKKSDEFYIKGGIDVVKMEKVLLNHLNEVQQRKTS